MKFHFSVAGGEGATEGTRSKANSLGFTDGGAAGFRPIEANAIRPVGIGKPTDILAACPAPSHGKRLRTILSHRENAMARPSSFSAKRVLATRIGVLRSAVGRVRYTDRSAVAAPVEGSQAGSRHHSMSMRSPGTTRLLERPFRHGQGSPADVIASGIDAHPGRRMVFLVERDSEPGQRLDDVLDMAPVSCFDPPDFPQKPRRIVAAQRRLFA